MQDLAPDIVRQRLLIEGVFESDVDREKVVGYLLGIAEHLALRTYGAPIVHSPEGDGKAENAGYDAFIPLIDSGISLYVWTERKFFAAVLFTCKRFEAEAAVAFTREYFAASAIESRAF